MTTLRGSITSRLVLLTVLPICLSAGTVSGRQSLSRLPLLFEENRGQADPSIRFLSRAPGFQLGLDSSGAVFAFPGAAGRKVVVRLSGANPEAAARPEGPMAAKINYLKGSASADWLAGVPVFARVRFESVYPGIDLVYYGKRNALEYDFAVAPGADPKLIRLRVEGADDARLDAEGNLVIRAAGHELRHHAPRLVAYSAAGEREVGGRFVMVRPGEFRFEVDSYDHTQALTIDPVLTYSSLLGGSLDDRIYAMAVDSSGYIYLAGETSSADIAIASPLQGAVRGSSDAFVAKLDPTGASLIYATYLGGSDRDGARGMTIDSSGAVYLAGFARSLDFPTTAGAYKQTNSGGEDVFVAKLAPSGGSLVYSTYLGGTGNEQARGIAVDSSGRAYITGYTNSVAFPRVQAVQAVYGGSMDAFAARLNAAGSALEYSTYLGGSGNDTGNAIAVDASGAAYIAGQTQSTNFPARNAYQPQKSFDADGFIVKLVAAGNAFAYSTYLGGRGLDEAKAIAVDSAGNAYVAGRTFSTDLPVTTGAYQTQLAGDQDAFIVKLNSVGSALTYCTYFGGSGAEDVSAIALAGGEAYIAGDTTSADLPTFGAGQDSFAGIRDAFVADFDADGKTLKGATYLGGSRDDYGRAIAVLGNQIYIAGYTFSWDYPTTAGAYGRGYTGSADMFFAILGTPASIVSPAPGSALTTASVTFYWLSAPGATAYRLDIGGTPGGTDLYTEIVGTATSKTVTLPADGRDIYVRLWTQISTWGYSDYTYQAASSGTKATMQSPAQGSTLPASTTFVWSPGQGVTEYWLTVGHGLGQGDIYTASQGAATSRTVSIPSDGSTIYVRLGSKIAGVWGNNDYYYQASQPAGSGKGAITSPLPGSQLSGSTVTFTWSAGSATQFWLDVGSSLGASDFYDGSQGAAISRTVSGLPVDSRMLYVRLWSLVSGQWGYSDYTFRAAPSGGSPGGTPTAATPSLSSPAPGSRIASSTVTFTWVAAAGVTAYWFDVGPFQSSGNFYDSAQGTGTSATVTGLPTDGSKIWVRLWWQKSGTWSYQDYSFN